MKIKPPSFPFYPDDWIRDTQVLSPATRGIWSLLFAHMWYMTPRGRLRSVTRDELCRLGACSHEQLKDFFSENKVHKFCNVTFRNATVTVTNRRMHAEEMARQADCLRQRKHRHGEVTGKSRGSLPSLPLPLPLQVQEQVHVTDAKVTEEVENLDLANLLSDLILASDSKAKTNPAGWALDIDKLHRLDGRERDEIEAVIRWCQADSFWQPNIRSGKKLRDKFDTLLGQMSRKQTDRRGDDFDNIF
jgi:uncharacterized protein YdaU (DUF1376 family)